MLRRVLASFLIAFLVAGPLQAPVAHADVTDGSTPLAERGSSGFANPGAVTGNASSDLFSGAAVFSYPLEVAPGTSGMQPSLGLIYNNQNRSDSFVGYGWSLPMRRIERSTKRGVPEYDDARDVFLLDGQELVPHADRPQRYSTRRESYLRIERLADGSWEVRDRDGKISRFGTRDDARVMRPDGRVAEALLSEVEDTDGNALVVEYDRSDPGTAYPAQIRYTLRRSGDALVSMDPAHPSAAERRVAFVVEARPDPVLSLRNGFRAEQTKRLKRIEISAGGNLVRRYDFTYRVSADTRRSLLASVAQRGSDAGTGATPVATSRALTTSFTYSNNAVTNSQGYLDSTPWTVPSGAFFALDSRASRNQTRSGGTQLADVNGDALPDLIVSRQMANGALTPESGVYLNTGSGFRTDKSSDYPLPQSGYAFTIAREPVPGASAEPFTTGTLLVDLNGDGRAELFRSLALLRASTGPNPPTTFQRMIENSYARNTGLGWTTAFQGGDLSQFGGGGSNALYALGNRPFEPTEGDTNLVELNGDGRPDLLFNEFLDEMLPNGTEVRRSTNLAHALNRGDDTGFSRIEQGFQLCDPGEETADAPCLFHRFTGYKVFSLAPPEALIVDVVRLGARYVDVNGDGLDDHLRAFESDYIDANGDGTVDPVFRSAFLNDGGDFRRDDAWALPTATDKKLIKTAPKVSREEGVRFFDVNGDGRIDVVQAAAGGPKNVWLNSGAPVAGDTTRPWNPQAASSPFQMPTGMEFVEYDGHVDTGVRTADLDGDGMTDLIRLREGRPPVVFLNRGEVPDQLVRVVQPFGGTMQFGYAPSTRFTNTTISGLPTLPQSVQVVTSLALNDLLNPVVRSTFSYAGGMYDARDIERRGFRMVDAIRESDGRVTRTYFHQDVERAGLVETVAVFDGAGNPYASTTNTYTDDDVPGAPYVRLLASTSRLEFPPPAVKSPTLRTLTTFSYERDGAGVIQFGRLAATTNYGAVDEADRDLDAGDTRTREIEYKAADLERNLVQLVSVTRLRAEGSERKIFRETQNFYDESDDPQAVPRGRLTRQVDMLGQKGKPDAVLKFAYDVYGNVTSVMSPRANAEQGGGTSTTEYDPTFHTFITQVTNAAQQVSSYTYAPDRSVCPDSPPPGAGLVYAVQTPNDTPASRSLRCYDALGRTTLEQSSGAFAVTTAVYVDTPGQARITTEQRVSADSSRQSIMFRDGFGRMNRMQVDGPQGGTLVVSTALDTAGRVAEQRGPYFASPAVPEPVRTFYDLMDRVIRVERPSAPTGGASATGVRITQASYTPTLVTSTDANGNVQRRTLDGFGRATAVDEVTPAATFTTRYEYDITGQITKVKDHDGNETTADYDMLGRRTRVVDPDGGTRTYDFDVEGHLIGESGPGGSMTLEYDALNRVKLRTAGTQKSETVYDGAPGGIGLVSKVTEREGEREVSSLEVLSYDALGHELSLRRSIDGLRFEFSNSFNALGESTTRTLPNARTVTQTYDAKGYLTSIASGGETQISDIQLDAAGRVLSWAAANGVRTTTALEAQTLRVGGQRVLTGSESSPTVLDDHSYAYDLGDRITAIDDRTQVNRDFAFGYDALDRLASASGPYGPEMGNASLFYRYGPTGNLTCLDSTSASACTGGRSMVYPKGGAGTARPHAPMTIDGAAVSYTPSGNMETLGARHYSYDPLDRLVAIRDGTRELASFAYSGSGDRIKATDSSGTLPVVRYTLADGFEFDATHKLARTQLVLNGSIVELLTEPYDPQVQKPAGAPVLAIGIDVGRALPSALLALGLFGLLVQLAELARRQRPLAQPALAGGLALVLGVLGAPGLSHARPLDGDLNRDGRLDSADVLIAIAIAQRVRAASAEELASGDVAPLAAAGGPAAIDAGDVVLLLRGSQGEDVDGDGLGTQVELAAGSSPFRADTDGDGLSDLDELSQGSDPARADSDFDGLSDVAEFAAHTDAAARDTDGDGLNDADDPEPMNGRVFLHADALGSTTLITGDGASVVQRTVYRPYGASVSTAAAVPAFGFTGQRFERTAAVYDYGARYYDPAIGRFLQPDDIVAEPQRPQTLNRYSYVENNPINRIDPSGNISLPSASDVFGFLGSIGTGLRDFRDQFVRGVQAVDNFFSGIRVIGFLVNEPLSILAFAVTFNFKDPYLRDAATGASVDENDSARINALAQQGFYVNGILTSLKSALDGARRAFSAQSNSQNAQGLVLVNPSDGVILDLLESAIGLFAPGVLDVDNLAAKVIMSSSSISYARGFSQGSIILGNGEFIAGRPGVVQQTTLTGSPRPALVSRLLITGSFRESPSLSINPASYYVKFFDPVYALGNPLAIPTGVVGTIVGNLAFGTFGAHVDSNYDVK